MEINYMKINVEFKRIHNDPSSRFKAIANIILEDLFIIRNVKLFYTDKTYVTMPSITGRSGRRFSPCHPLTSEFNAELVDMIWEAYLIYNADTSADEDLPQQDDDIEEKTTETQGEF